MQFATHLEFSECTEPRFPFRRGSFKLTNKIGKLSLFGKLTRERGTECYGGLFLENK